MTTDNTTAFNVTLRTQMKDLANALMHDVSDQYENGDHKDIFNSLQRLLTGAEALHHLADTADVLASFEEASHD